MSRSYLPITAALAVTSLSCGGGPGTTPAQRTASALIIVSGDQQTGTVGHELPQPLVVRVVDATGAPIQGQIVNFVVVNGGGTVFVGAGTSDLNGVAQERWTLGVEAGTQELEARAVDSVTGNAMVFATFRVTTVADAPASVTVLAGDGQTAPPGTALGTAIRVQVLDEYGNPVAGQPVRFASTAGSGSAAPPTVTTDSSGQAVTVWTLGAEDGVQRLGVQAGAVGTTVTADGCTPTATNICVTPGVVGVADCEGTTPLSFAWATDGIAYSLSASDQPGCPVSSTSTPNAHTVVIASNIISTTGFHGGTTVAAVMNDVQIPCFSSRATVYFCLWPDGTTVTVAAGTLELQP